MPAATGRQSFEQSGDVVRERLQWSLNVGERSHALNILPALLGGSVSIELDGRTVTRLSKPKPQKPWQEAALEIHGEQVTVVLIWNRPIMRTDVFVAGRSLIDGRTIDEARQSAPSPLSDYEVWIGGYFRNAIPPRRPLMPPRFALLALAAVIALVGWSALVPRPSGLGAGAVVGVALWTLVGIWFRSWFVVMERAHVHLLSHPELGDVGRQVRFFAAFLGYVLASGAIVTAFLIVLSR